MAGLTFRKVPMPAVAAAVEDGGGDWLWHGYLAGGDVTLLTSAWKTGKTTLLAGVLAAMGSGGEFLGRALRAGRACVVSEESHAQWAERLQAMPIGPHAELLARPFRGRPSPDEWDALIDDAVADRRRGDLDLFVVDPLASFLPGRCESDAATLLEAMQPLHRLTAAGAAVLLLHHPRKKPAEVGSAARGSGALLGFVDIVLELHRHGRLKSDACRRQITALSRRPATPERLAYEWNPTSGRFTPLGDPRSRQYEENWQQVLTILRGRRTAATHQELLADWPDESGRPAASALYEWLNRAYAEKRVRREGNGTRVKPWRYRLANADDAYWDRGELPPITDFNG